MRAVWSLWTKPMREGSRGSPWLSEKHHLLAWVLSVETARRHYPETSLVTDDDGARMLIDGLGLQFGHVSTDLNLLHAHDPDWWAFGKIYAYARQSEPFVHIDTDVILWQALPERLERADVFGQQPEHIHCGFSWYYPEKFESAIRSVDGWMPEELNTYAPIDGSQNAVCCAIFGGTRVDFIRHYAQAAMRLIEHPRNQPAWLRLGDRTAYSIIFEQYLLAACVAGHQHNPRSPYRDIRVEYLFQSYEDAAVNASRVGYTHLWCEGKRNPALLDRLEKRVQQAYPELYERCIAYAGQ